MRCGETSGAGGHLEQAAGERLLRPHLRIETNGRRSHVKRIERRATEDAAGDPGHRKLDRHARLLEQYGGTVRYETRSTDGELVAARIEFTTAYLQDTGMDMTDVRVESGLPGGRGMAARQAIKAKKNGEAASSKIAASGGASTK